VQDGVHPAAEAVGDELEEGGRAMDHRPASDPRERDLERGVSILPGLEADDPDRDSTDDSEAKGLKGRIIAGNGVIAPTAIDEILSRTSRIFKGTPPGLDACW
jgi:hypothetical protein